MSAGVIIAAVIGLVAIVWMWRSGAFSGIGQGAMNIWQIPGSAAAPAGAIPPGTGATTLPPITPCNCTTNVSCNAFCSNVASFNQCCFGSTTPPPAAEAPEPDPSLCSSQFNGSCNTECSTGTEEECIECNGVCDENVAYTGDEPLEEEVTAGAATPTCPAGYVYSATQNLCIQSTAGAAQPTCPAGYAYDVTHNLCVQSTAAPVYPTTPIPPPLTTRDAARCSDEFNGSCNTECSSGSQSECNECMLVCGQATGGSAGTGRTAECSSRYNGSCNTECSSGNNSTCNSCRAACGLAANIATVRTASQARHLMQNRLYNALKAQSYRGRRARVGYDRQSRAVGNIIRVGNLF